MTPLERYLMEHPGPHRPRERGRVLTPSQVEAVRKSTLSLKEIADPLMVSTVTIWKIKHRITYRNLP